jgi:hypothetical protein
MKNALILIGIFFLVSSNLFSQVEPAEEHDTGGFGALLIEMGPIDKQYASLIGGGCGFIVKDIRIGGFFVGLINRLSLHDIRSVNTYRMKLSYGGLWVGYPLWKKHRFHALTDLKVCFGTTATQNADDIYKLENRNFFYGFIPYVGMEFNITENFTITAGLEYRFCFFPNRVENHKTNLLNMPSARIGLQLGIF